MHHFNLTFGMPLNGPAFIEVAPAVACSALSCMQCNQNVHTGMTCRAKGQKGDAAEPESIEVSQDSSKWQPHPC